MALTSAQLDKVSEITGEDYATVASAAPNLNASQEAAIIADIATWDVNRDKLKVKMSGGRDGIDFSISRLLDAITERTRLRFGFPSLNSSVAGVSTSAITRGIW